MEQTSHSQRLECVGRQGSWLTPVTTMTVTNMELPCVPSWNHMTTPVLTRPRQSQDKTLLLLSSMKSRKLWGLRIYSSPNVHGRRWPLPSGACLCHPPPGAYLLGLFFNGSTSAFRAGPSLTATLQETGGEHPGLLLEGALDGRPERDLRLRSTGSP